MACFTTDHIKPYRTYENWASHEAYVKPIRGRDVKPIARRKDWHMSISRDGDDIILREQYHWKNSTQVVYQKDGTMKLLVPDRGKIWGNGQRFFFATTGISVHTSGGREWIDMGHGSQPVLLDTSKGVVTFKRNPENTRWVLAEGGSTGTHYVFNRKAFNAVKKRLQPYMTQLEIFLKLKAEHVVLPRSAWSQRDHTISGVAVATHVYNSAMGDDDEELETFRSRMEGDDLEGWLAMHELFLQRGPRDHIAHYGGGRVTHYKRPEDVISYAWEQVKRIYRNEIFEAKPNTKSSHKRDPNRKYFL
jgi:hypothetical protein